MGREEVGGKEKDRVGEKGKSCGGSISRKKYEERERKWAEIGK